MAKWWDAPANDVQDQPTSAGSSLLPAVSPSPASAIPGPQENPYLKSAMARYQQMRESARASLAAPSVPAPDAPAPVPQEKSGFNLSNVGNALWEGATQQFVPGVKSALAQAYVGLDRPDTNPDWANRWMAEGNQAQQQAQAKTQQLQQAGKSDSTSEAIREAVPSLGFSLGSLASGLATAAPVAAMTGGLATIPALGASLIGSGVAGYRMAGAQYLNDTFNELNKASVEKRGRALDETEKQRAYEVLKPIAEHTGLWEAGPEAIGNAATIGLGGVALGFLGKEALAKISTSALKQAGMRAAAGAAEVGTELGTETVTQIPQGNDQAKSEAMAAALRQGKSVETALSEGQQAAPQYEGAAGALQAFKDIAPQTLATIALMGTGAKAAHWAAQPIQQRAEANQAGQQATQHAELAQAALANLDEAQLSAVADNARKVLTDHPKMAARLRDQLQGVIAPLEADLQSRANGDAFRQVMTEPDALNTARGQNAVLGMANPARVAQLSDAEVEAAGNLADELSQHNALDEGQRKAFEQAAQDYRKAATTRRQMQDFDAAIQADPEVAPLITRSITETVLGNKKEGITPEYARAAMNDGELTRHLSAAEGLLARHASRLDDTQKQTLTQARDALLMEREHRATQPDWQEQNAEILKNNAPAEVKLRSAFTENPEKAIAAIDESQRPLLDNLIGSLDSRIQNYAKTGLAAPKELTEPLARLQARKAELDAAKAAPVPVLAPTATPTPTAAPQPAPQTQAAPIPSLADALNATPTGADLIGQSHSPAPAPAPSMVNPRTGRAALTRPALPSRETKVRPGDVSGQEELQRLLGPAPTAPAVPVVPPGAQSLADLISRPSTQVAVAPGQVGAQGPIAAPIAPAPRQKLTQAEVKARQGKGGNSPSAPAYRSDEERASAIQRLTAEAKNDERYGIATSGDTIASAVRYDAPEQEIRSAIQQGEQALDDLAERYMQIADSKTSAVQTNNQGAAPKISPHPADDYKNWNALTDGQVNAFAKAAKIPKGKTRADTLARLDSRLTQRDERLKAWDTAFTSAPTHTAPATSSQLEGMLDEKGKAEALLNAGTPTADTESRAQTDLKPKAAKLPASPRPTYREKTALQDADDLLTAIAKLGGLRRQDAEAVDAIEFKRMPVFGKPVFRKNGGKTLDEMAEALHEAGYPVQDADGNYNANTLMDRIHQALSGKDVLTAEGQQQAMQQDMEDRARMAEERDWALDDADLDASGYTDLDANEQAISEWKAKAYNTLGEDATESLFERIAEKSTGTDAEFLKELNDAYARELEASRGHRNQTRKNEPSQQGEAESSGREESPLLESYTKAELDARAEAVAKAQAEQAAKDKAADEKAAADEAGKRFKLSGSDRPADVAAANGQADLLAGVKTAPKSPATKNPWQLTKNEYLESIGHTWRKVENGTVSKQKVITSEKLHQRLVEAAIAEGKPVPAEVLADYPDLVKKAPVAPETVDIAAKAKARTQAMEDRLVALGWEREGKRVRFNIGGNPKGGELNPKGNRWAYFTPYQIFANAEVGNGMDAPIRVARISMDESKTPADLAQQFHDKVMAITAPENRVGAKGAGAAEGKPGPDAVKQSAGISAPNLQYVPLSQIETPFQGNNLKALAGDALVQDLLDNGRLNLVARQNQLPSSIKIPSGERVAGAVDPETGQVYLVAENIRPDEIQGFLTHEIGVHQAQLGLNQPKSQALRLAHAVLSLVGAKQALGEASFADVLSQMERMHKAGSQPVMEAFRQADAAMTALGQNSALRNEEALAYLVQNHPQHSLVKRLIAAVRAFLYRAGFRINLTESDLHALAVSALKGAARQDSAMAGAVSPGARGRSPEDAEAARQYAEVVARYKGTARLVDDVPNENWLKTKVAFAKKQPRTEYDVPFMGEITGHYTEMVTLPIELLSTIKGASKEQLNVREDDIRRHKNYYEKNNAFLHNPYIEVGYDGVPYVAEGNHRIMAAAQLGVKYLPVEIRYFDGGERMDGALSPAVVMQQQKSPQWMKAPNGKPTKLNERQWVQTRTENFKKWFDGSKVVDENGDPRVVFHGTGSDISSFDLKIAQDKEGRKRGLGLGKDKIYFAGESIVASGFATAAPVRKLGKAPNVIPVFLSLKNPIGEAEYYARFKELSGKALFDSTLDKKDRDRFIALLDRQIKKEKFDGITQVHSDGNFGQITAFSPTQIKSAIGNTGAFSPNNADIRYAQRLGETEPNLTADQLLSRIEAGEDVTPEQWAQVQAYLRAAAQPASAGNTLKEWFGASKIKNSEGQPLTMYHGTAARFNAFDATRSGGSTTHPTAALGFFFTNNRGHAAEKYAGSGGKVLDVYLAVEKPYQMTDADLRAIDGATEAVAFRKKLEANGYDGVIMPREVAGTVYVAAFRPDQIKLTSNETFTKGEADMRFARAYTADQDAAMDKIGKRPSQTWASRIAGLTDRMGLKLRQAVADHHAALLELDRQAYGNDVVENDTAAASWVKARLSRSVDGPMNLLLHETALKMDTDGALDVIQGSKGLQQILEPLGSEADDFLKWVAGWRASRLKQEDRERLFTDADIAALKALNQGDMADGRKRSGVYGKALREFAALQKSVMDIAEQAGLIDGAERGVWERDFYVPFYRLAEDTQDVRSINAGDGLARQEAFKKLKGGKDRLNDLLENTVMNWHHLLSASLKNNAARQALQNAQRVDYDGVKVAEPINPNKESTKGAVYYRENGQPQWFRVNDPLVLEAITSLDFTGMKGPVMKLLRKARHLLTRTTTISPAFKVANLLRDTVQTLAVSQASAKTGGLGNIVQGWKNYAADSEIRQSLLAGGGAFRFGSTLEDNADALRKLLTKGVRPETILDTPKKLWDVLSLAYWKWEDLGDRLENVNRAALYTQLRDQGKSHLYASFQARDLLDFSQSGASGAVRFLTAVVPFLNARIQGLDKLGRAASQPASRGRFATTLAATTLASALLYLLFKDDKDFKEREEWDRDTYWWFKIGGVPFRIPKPFEIGALATLLGDRVVEQITDKEANSGLYLDRLRHTLTQTFSISGPQLLMPALSVYANKDPFTGRSIETLAQQRLSPKQRQTARTSDAARGISTATGGFVSPIQADYLVGAYFGWLGRQATLMADYVTRPLTDRPNPDKVPVIGDLMQRFVPTEEGGNSKYLTRFYEAVKASEQHYADIRELLKRGDESGARMLANRYRDELTRLKGYRAASVQLHDWNNQLRMIADLPVSKMNEAQRQVARDALQSNKRRLARALMEGQEAP